MDIRYSRSAQRALSRSNKRELIAGKIRDLANDPLAPQGNVIRLKGREEYRLRVQDWRIIFRVDDGILWIDDIGPRGSIYER